MLPSGSPMHAATPRSGAVQARSRLDRLTQRLFSFPAVIVGILIAKAFWTCRSRIADPDIWWHLRNADVLVSTHHFPNSDTYSFTAAGAPWVNHAWLSELVFFFSYRALGLRGLFVVSFLAVAALSLSIFFLCRRPVGGTRKLRFRLHAIPRPRLPGSCCRFLD